MKTKLFSNIYVVAILMAIFGLASCQTENPFEPVERDFDYSVVLATPDVMLGNLSDASLTNDFTLTNVYDHMLYSPNGKGPNPDAPKPGPAVPPIKLGQLLRMLELDSAQIEKVKAFMKEFEECAKEYRIKLRDAQRQILEAANLQRRQILEDLRAGKITREEAWQMLKQLREETRLQMETNEDIVAAREALKNCHDALLENIKSILTTKQLDIWNKYFGIKG